MFDWKESYTVNIAEIDKQHKKLFKLGEDLAVIISLNDGYDHYDEIVNALHELKKYTIYHFDYEESLMKKYNFNGLDTQRKEHNDFIRMLNRKNKI